MANFLNSETAITARHEAGHAVVAVRLGYEIHTVSVLPAPGRLGNCVSRSPARTPERRRKEDVAVHLGGAAAEILCVGLRDVSLAEAEMVLAGCESDFRAARRPAGPGWAGEHRLRSGWSAALAGLARHWDTAARLAELLMAEGAVPGWRVQEVVRGE